MISSALINILQYQKRHYYCEKSLGKPEMAQNGKTGGNGALKFLQQLLVKSSIVTASAKA